MEIKDLKQCESRIRNAIETQYRALAACTTVEQVQGHSGLLAESQEDLADVEALKRNPAIRTRLAVKLELGTLRLAVRNLRLFNIRKDAEINAQAERLETSCRALEAELAALNAAARAASDRA